MSLQNSESCDWRASNLISPYFNGGKVCFSRTGLTFMHNANVSSLKLSSLTQMSSFPSIWENVSDHCEKITGNVEINCFCVSKDGDALATVSTSFLLQHWIISEKMARKSIKIHKTPVSSIEFDATSTLVATGSSDGSVRVWDVFRGYCTHTFKGQSEIIRVLSFRQDSTAIHIYSGSDDGSIRCYDLLKSNCVADFRHHVGCPTALSFSIEDSGVLATVGRDKVLNLYDTSRLMHLKTVPLMEELEAVVSLSMESSKPFLGTPESGRTNLKRKAGLNTVKYVIITAGARGLLRICRVDYEESNLIGISCEPIMSFSASNGAIVSSFCKMVSTSGVSSLFYNDVENEILVASTDNVLSTFALSGCNEIRKTYQSVGSFDDILDIAIIEDETSSTLASCKFAIVSNSTILHLVDYRGHTNTCIGHTDVILAVEVFPGGETVLTSSKDQTCRLWDSFSQQCVGVAEGHTDAIGCICVSQTRSNSGSSFFISGGADKVLKLWHVSHKRLRDALEEKTCFQLAAICSVRAHNKDINTVDISPNDAVVASGSQDSTIRLWNSSDLTPIGALTGHKRGVWCVKFSPIDKCLASAAGDRTVKVWSLIDYSCLRTMQGHTSSVLSLQFVDSGMQLLSGAADGLIRVWTVRNGECKSVLDHHTDKVWAIRQLESGSVLSTGSDATVVCWRDATEENDIYRREVAEGVVLLEQTLSNALNRKQYGEALKVSLKLKYPNRVLAILKSIVEEYEDGSLLIPSSSFSCSILDEYIRSWSESDIIQIMTYAKEWNMNGKNSRVISLLVQGVTSILGMQRLKEIPEILDIVSALLSYSERHFNRLNKLQEALYLVEYVCSESIIHDL